MMVTFALMGEQCRITVWAVAPSIPGTIAQLPGLVAILRRILTYVVSLLGSLVDVLQLHGLQHEAVAGVQVDA